MTIKVRPYKRGGWEVDIMLTMPGRPKIRERRKAPVSGKLAARRWGEERERQLIQHYNNTDPSDDDDEGSPALSKERTPTLAQFAPRYIEAYCEANRLKPATIYQRRQQLRNHLLPAFGRKRLDRITAEDLQQFKAERSDLAPSTLNNLLTVFTGILNVAFDWGVISTRPLKTRKLKEGPRDFVFYDFAQFDQLVLQAESHPNPSRLVMVLLGGEAGLRCGEMRALTWSDVDLDRGTLTVSRAYWKNVLGPPKGGRSRTVELGPRLNEALVAHRRRLQGPSVLLTRDGAAPSETAIRAWLNAMQRALGWEETGPHTLRRTFCSHLAMLGQPAPAIQKLAGHADLKTTQRYMFLSKGATRTAIEALRRPDNWRHAGNGSSRVVNIH